MTNLKYGKTPARPGAMKLALRDYLTTAKLPTAPADFGHDGLIGTDWGMLGNDQYGDCVWAGACHETMMWNKEADKTVAFTTQDALDGYTAVTGFNPADPNTDQGTDMVKAAEYRRTVGVRDSKGLRHKVGAYLSISPGDLAEVAAAVYLFGAVGIGIEVPESAQDQFSNGQPWSVVPGAQIEGGHYIPFVGRRAGLLHIVTWGRVQKMTPEFFTTYCDEAIAYVSTEALKGGKSLEGFDMKALQADLALLHRA